MLIRINKLMEFHMRISFKREIAEVLSCTRTCTKNKYWNKENPVIFAVCFSFVETICYRITCTDLSLKSNVQTLTLACISKSKIKNKRSIKGWLLAAFAFYLLLFIKISRIFTHVSIARGFWYNVFFKHNGPLTDIRILHYIKIQTNWREKYLKKPP